MPNKPTFCLLLISVIFIIRVNAQPYLDLLNARVTHSPNISIINGKKENIQLTYYNFSTSLPLQFKNKKDALIISPFFERWKFETEKDQKDQHYYGLVLPVSLLKQINYNWSVIITAIVRMNDSTLAFNMKSQKGGAVIFNYKRNKNLTYKFGTYLNKEYFGVFFMPLMGIDWKIDEKNDVFGVLPGNLTYQHRLSSRTAYGAAFRAQTNSYYRSQGNYTRVDENQLGGFFDLYVTPNIVFNTEAGHSLFRKIRTNATANCLTGSCNLKYNDYKVNDNIYFKLSMAYRLTLREQEN